MYTCLFSRPIEIGISTCQDTCNGVKNNHIIVIKCLLIFSHRKEIRVGFRISAKYLQLKICISFKHTRVRCEDWQICEHRYLWCYKYANVLLNDYTEARKIRAATSTPHSSATYPEAVVLAKSGECFYKTLARNPIYLHTMTFA